MKALTKIFAGIIAVMLISAIVGGLIYTIYVRPLSGLGLHEWYYYVVAILMLTILYVTVVAALIGVFSVLEWALSKLLK
jgi:hypothetical protein